VKKGETFVSLQEAPFTRRNSYFVFLLDNYGDASYGGSALYFGLTRARPGIGSFACEFRTIRVDLLSPDGESVPAVVSTTPYELIYESDYGSVRFCLGEQNLLKIRGTDGVGLSLSANPADFSGRARDMCDGAWELDSGRATLRFTPITGKCAFSAPRAPTGLAAAFGCELLPDDNGVIELAVEEYVLVPPGRVAADFPSYDKCVSNVREDFDGFVSSLSPALPGKYEKRRLQALWNTWTLIHDVDAYSLYKRPMVTMTRSSFEGSFGWQQAMHAIYLSENVPLAWEVLCSPLDFMQPNGHAIDGVNDAYETYGTYKTPFQGVALQFLYDNCDLSAITREQKADLYVKLGRWTDFFFNFRDLDGDGVVESQKAFETGYEDCTLFKPGFPLAHADINAFLAIQMEMLARLGRDAGVDEGECARWEERSKTLVDKIIEMFWNGERWIAKNISTGEIGQTKNITFAFPLILGKRLPREIIDKTVDWLTRECDFFTPYGLASESLDSPYLSHGWFLGTVASPVQTILTLGLEASGRRDLAEKIALSYCDLLYDTGFYHMHNELTGLPDSELMSEVFVGTDRLLYWVSWGSSSYFYLAKRYGGK
jgi:hypothetical protein